MNKQRVQVLFPITRISWKEFLAYPDVAQERYIKHLSKDWRCSIQQMSDTFKVSRFVLQNHCKLKGIPLGQVQTFRPSPNKDFLSFMKKEDALTQRLRRRMALYDSIVKTRKMGLTLSQVARVTNCSSQLTERVLHIWELAKKEDVDALRRLIHDPKFGLVGAVRWACIRCGVDLRVLMTEPMIAEVPVAVPAEAPVTSPAEAPVIEPALQQLEQESNKSSVNVTEFKSVLQEFNGHMRFLRAFFAKSEPVPQA